MSFLSRLFGKNIVTWEELFTQEELGFFYSQVRNHFSSRGITINIKKGYVISKTGTQKMDLRNLAQSCHQQTMNQWPAIIDAHFQQLEKIMIDAQEKSSSIFTDIIDVLAVRLFPDGTLTNVGSNNIVYRKDLYGTISTLALDLPDSIVAVTPNMIESWGKNADELFSLGYKNVVKLCKPDIVEAVLAGDIKTLMLSKPDNYLASTYILLLDDFPNCVGAFGSLVSAPLRDIVICYPIDNSQNIDRVTQVLAYTTLDIYKEGPGSVSPYLYWYYKGRFENILYDEKHGLKIPQELTKMFNPDLLA
jgi:uncharacterized protein YtpQ (UPF0354 family)